MYIFDCGEIGVVQGSIVNEYVNLVRYPARVCVTLGISRRPHFEWPISWMDCGARRLQAPHTNRGKLRNTETCLSLSLPSAQQCCSAFGDAPARLSFPFCCLHPCVSNCGSFSIYEETRLAHRLETKAEQQATHRDRSQSCAGVSLPRANDDLGHVDSVSFWPLGLTAQKSTFQDRGSGWS